MCHTCCPASFSCELHPSDSMQIRLPFFFNKTRTPDTHVKIAHRPCSVTMMTYTRSWLVSFFLFFCFLGVYCKVGKGKRCARVLGNMALWNSSRTSSPANERVLVVCRRRPCRVAGLQLGRGLRGPGTHQRPALSLGASHIASRATFFALLYYPLPIYSIYLSIGRECAIKKIYTEIFTTGFFCCSLSYGVNNFPILHIPLLIPKEK